MVRPGFTIPILSSLPDIPHLYTTNPALSFLVDAIALAVMFATLLAPLGIMLFSKGDDKSKAMGKKFGAVLGVILGLSAAFALRRAGIPLFEYWLTTVIAAAVIGIALFMMLQKLTGGKYKLITGLICLLIAWMIMDFWFVTSNNPTVRNVFGFISLIGPILFVLFLIWVLMQLTGKGAPGGEGGGGGGGGGGGFWKKFGDGLGGVLGWAGNNLIKKPFGGIYDAFKAVGKDIAGWFGKTKKAADDAKSALDRLDAESRRNDKDLDELEHIATEVQKLIDQEIPELERANRMLDDIKRRIAALEGQINDIGTRLQGCVTKERLPVSADLLQALILAVRTWVARGTFAAEVIRAVLQRQGADEAAIERIMSCMAAVLEGRGQQITPINVDIARFKDRIEKFFEYVEASRVRPTKQLVTTIASLKGLKARVEEAIALYATLQKAQKEIDLAQAKGLIDSIPDLAKKEEMLKKFEAMQAQNIRLTQNLNAITQTYNGLQNYLEGYQQQSAQLETDYASFSPLVKAIETDVKAARALIDAILQQETPEAQLQVVEQIRSMLGKILKDDLFPLRARWVTIKQRLQIVKTMKSGVNGYLNDWKNRHIKTVQPALDTLVEFNNALTELLKMGIIKTQVRPTEPEPPAPAPAGGGAAAPPEPPVPPAGGQVNMGDIIAILEAEKLSLNAAVDKIAKLVESLQFEEQFKKQKSKVQTEEKAKELVRKAVKDSEVELDIDKKKIAASVANLEKVAHTVADAITLMETSALPESQAQVQQLKMIRGNLLLFIRAQPDLIEFLTRTKEALASTVAEYVVGSKSQTIMQSTAKSKLEQYVQALREWIAFISAEEVKLEAARGAKTVIIPGPATETGRPPRAKPKSVR